MKKTAGKEGGLCVSASVLRVRTCNSPAAPSRPAAIADGRRCWGILATILLRGTALSSRAMSALKCCGPPFAASKAGSLWVPLLCFLIAASVAQFLPPKSFIVQTNVAIVLITRHLYQTLSVEYASMVYATVITVFPVPTVPSAPGPITRTIFQ